MTSSWYNQIFHLLYWCRKHGRYYVDVTYIGQAYITLFQMLNYEAYPSLMGKITVLIYLDFKCPFAFHPNVYIDWFLSRTMIIKTDDTWFVNRLGHCKGVINNIVLCIVEIRRFQDRLLYLMGIHSLVMTTSSNGNVFSVTGPLCGEFTGHRWIPLTKASDAELWGFLWSATD